MALLVGADRELRDVRVHRALGHVEADVSAARAALLGGDERQVHRVRHEIGLQQQALLLALVGEVVGLAGEARLEVVRRVEDEVDVFVEVDHRGGVRHGDEARGLGARTVEVLMPGVQRNREQRAGLPFEGDLLARVVPHGGGAAAFENEDHFLEELTLGRELLARRDLADVAIVRRARGFVVDVDALAVAARPVLQLYRAQVLHVMGRDDVEAFVAHPAQIRRVLLGRELLGKIVRNNCVLRHFFLR